MNVAGEAWRAAGIGLRRVMCSVMRCTGIAGSEVGVSSSQGIFRGSLYTIPAGPL
jgi:hypothetical protein